MDDSTKQELLIELKKWWNTTEKDNNTLQQLLNRKISIDGYTFTVTSGHRSFINAHKDGSEFTIIDCGDPVNQAELYTILKKKFNENTATGRRSILRRHKSTKNKLRKRKSTKNKLRKRKLNKSRKITRH